jgi:hypothetical protein
VDRTNVRRALIHNDERRREDVSRAHVVVVAVVVVVDGGGDVVRVDQGDDGVDATAEVV